MKKIEFSNHVELVKAAKEVFTDDYKFAYDYLAGTCRYRMKVVDPEDDTDIERRCLIGRLFTGHIPETHRFWDFEGSAMELVGEFPIMREVFPWMDWGFAQEVQKVHDRRAVVTMRPLSWDERPLSWDQLESKAEELDKRQ